MLRIAVFCICLTLTISSVSSAADADANRLERPNIVNCPSRIPTATESDVLLNAADVLPTLADLAGAELPANTKIDGQSFANVLRDNSDDAWTRPWTFTQYADARVVRDQRYKLYSSGAFFDMAADPLERHPLAGADLTSQESQPYAALQTVLDSMPENAKWPWTFRSISAARHAKPKTNRDGKNG